MDNRFREAADAGWTYLQGRIDAGERLGKPLFMEALKRAAPALRKQGVEQVEDRIEKLIDHAAEGMKKFAPVPGNEEADQRAFGANASRRAGLEDALKVVRGEADSIGDRA